MWNIGKQLIRSLYVAVRTQLCSNYAADMFQLYSRYVRSRYVPNYVGKYEELTRKLFNYSII